MAISHMEPNMWKLELFEKSRFQSMGFDFWNIGSNCSINVYGIVLGCFEVCNLVANTADRCQENILKTSQKGRNWGYFWTSNQDIAGTKSDMDMFESVLENLDFTLYEGKTFGYHRILCGTQKCKVTHKWKLWIWQKISNSRVGK